MIDLEGFTIEVNEQPNGDLTLEWDGENPIAIELGINEWTSDDWASMLEAAAKRELEGEDFYLKVEDIKSAQEVEGQVE